MLLSSCNKSALKKTGKRVLLENLDTQNFFSICRLILHIDHEDDRVDQNNEASRGRRLLRAIGFEDTKTP